MLPEKKFLPALVSGVLVAIAIPVFAWFRRIADVPVEVPVTVFELGESGLGGSFSYNWEFLVNILAMTFGLNIAFWVAFKALLQKVDGRVRLKLVLELCAVLLIIASVMGVVFHWGLDRANGFYKGQYGQDTSNLYLYLYWGDEFVGHALQETTILGYFVLLSVVEHFTEKPRTVHWIDLAFMAGIAASLTVSIGYAALISESAMLMLICSAVVLATTLVLVLRGKANLRDSPLLLATMIAAGIAIIQHVVFIGIYGVIPWYPWLRPS